MCSFCRVCACLCVGGCGCGPAPRLPVCVAFVFHVRRLFYGCGFVYATQGDHLVFKYSRKHNVYLASGEGAFNTCDKNKMTLIAGTEAGGPLFSLFSPFLLPPPPLSLFPAVTFLPPFPLSRSLPATPHTRHLRRRVPRRHVHGGGGWRRLHREVGRFSL